MSAHPVSSPRDTVRPEPTLRSLGLSADAAACYALLLEQPLLDLAEITDRSGIDVDRVEESMHELTRAQLVHPSHSSSGRWRATSPEVALPALVGSAEAELQAHQARVADLRGEVAGLIARHRVHRAENQSGELEELTGPDEVVGRIEELGRAAEHEILAVMPRRPSEQAMSESRAGDREVLQRGVRLRTMHLTAHLDDARFRSDLEAFIALGGQARVLPTLPVRMNIYDRRLAVVALDPEDATRGAVVCHAPGIVIALTTLFDLCWENATPASESTEVPHGALSPSERQLLKLLARGLKDESVARHMGVSVRTARRVISQLAERAEASSRFELALKAHQLGWV